MSQAMHIQPVSGPANAPRSRVAIEYVSPEVEGGRFPIKRVVGEKVDVRASIFADGHDVVVGVLRYRHVDEEQWTQRFMTLEGNDRWLASFEVERLGRYRYTVAGWVDPLATWQQRLEKKAEAGQDVAVELLAGAEILERIASRSGGRLTKRLDRVVEALRDTACDEAERLQVALDPSLVTDTRSVTHLGRLAELGRELEVMVDPVKARFSTWYEMFPRSAAGEAGRHGTFEDVIERLPYVASMGFDVLYLPPIHPIGETFRKGPDNTPSADPADVGSPWAIGSEDGGHKAVHPQLGTLTDFRRLVTVARDEYGIDVALDIALQCSPDHPYVREHPEWFEARPDGSIRYAENPPKKYQDIYPFDFQCDDWAALWRELASIFEFWSEQGVRIFRVDNPHTKPFAFWEWLIDRIKGQYPETIFLSEAFTRPHVKYRLAKLGFTQGYTYFAWKNTRWELTQYLTELVTGHVREYFRPNLWPNTPDILNEYLQTGGRPAFMTRLALAATLGASYGIYGPAFELCEGTPRERGSEEYRHSEKYQLRVWDLDRAESLRYYIGRINEVRRSHPALQTNETLQFHPTDNEHVLAYSKRSGRDVVIVVANLDPFWKHGAHVTLPLEMLNLDTRHPYQVHDLMSDARYFWNGATNYVELDPQRSPVHIFRVRTRVRTEQDFEYFE